MKIIARFLLACSCQNGDGILALDVARLAFSEALHGKIAEADLFTFAEGVIIEVVSRAKR